MNFRGQSEFRKIKLETRHELRIKEQLRFLVLLYIDDKMVRYACRLREATLNMCEYDLSSEMPECDVGVLWFWNIGYGGDKHTV